MGQVIDTPAGPVRVQDATLLMGRRTTGALVAVVVDADGNVGITAPAGGATAAKQPALGTALAPSADVITVQRPAVTQVVSSALEASHVLKASPGQLVQLSVFNGGPAQFLMLINAIALPGDGAVTLAFPPIPIAANTTLVLDLPAPVVCSTGLVICNSTTGGFTKTIGAADCAFFAQLN